MYVNPPKRKIDCQRKKNISSKGSNGSKQIGRKQARLSWHLAEIAKLCGGKEPSWYSWFGGRLP